MKIISHEHPFYKQKWRQAGANKYNGAYYYSQEIVKNIIPNVKTDRNWVTVNIAGTGAEHAIVFIHNNLHPENYDWLKKYNDLVLVCGIPETVEKMAHLGKAVYLPLSIDTEYVKTFAVPKEERHGAAWIGRPAKRRVPGVEIPEGIDIIEGLERSKMLAKMARYETVYAVGRTAIEAKALGCKLKPYDPRFPKVSRWKVVDNLEAAAELQKILDGIDGNKPQGR